MRSAFGVDHGEISKGMPGLGATWRGMSTGQKATTVGGSLAAGAGVGAYNKKKTGRITGNGGLVGSLARKKGMGYQKSTVPPRPGM
jgi:hypothetical protein